MDIIKKTLGVWQPQKNALKIAASICYYCLFFQCIYYHLQLFQVVLAVLSVIALLILCKKRDIYDHYAYEAHSRADAIYIKAFSVLFFLRQAIPHIIGNPLTAGYFIVTGIVIITIVRTILFCAMDSRE